MVVILKNQNIIMNKNIIMKKKHLESTELPEDYLDDNDLEKQDLRPIPGTETLVFKPVFIERYSKLTDWETFKSCSLSFLRRSIRVNTIYSTVEEVKNSILKRGWKLKQIPWCKEGFWIEHDERRDVGNLLEHHQGKIYVQESASMLPPLVLDPQPGDLVLDMCAAPGSKTTQMGAMMKNKGLIVANDYDGQRLQSLGINLQKSGLTNVLISLMHGKRFFGFQFDRILVDAPCSGTGTLRRSLGTIKRWNPGVVRKLSRMQRELLDNAFRNLRPGGTLVYSTCSLEPEEDEAVVSGFLQDTPDAEIQNIKLPGLKRSPPIEEFEGQKFDSRVKECIRIWPQDNDSEGFFVAKFKKKE